MLNDFFSIIDQKRKISFFFLILFMLLVALVETATIAALVPVADIIMTGEGSQYLNFIISFFGILEFPSKEKILIILTIFLFIIFGFKAILSGTLLFAQSKFIFGLKNYVSTELFLKYLYSSYTYHSEKSSSLMLRNLTLETGELIGRFVQPLTILITDIILLCFIATLLFINDPLTFALIVGVLSIALGSFMYATKNLSNAWGLKRQEADGLRIKAAQEALAGIIDVKVYSLQKFYRNKYLVQMEGTTKSEAYQFFLSQIPKPILELFAILGLLLIVVSNYFFQSESTNVIPTLALYSAAIFKIMPSINRILYCFQNIRFAGPVLRLFLNELTSAGEVGKFTNGKKTETFDKFLKLENVTYSYPNSNDNALENISVQINKNTSVAIVGSSGSGKTTLVNLILGLIKPKSGNIYADNKKLEYTNELSFCNFGYVPQKIFIAEDTFANNIALGVDKIDTEALKIAIISANLAEVVERLPEREHTNIGENGARLSGGEIQRIGIARAIYFNSEVLVFDEATSALDDTTEKEIVHAIDNLKKNKTIIIIAHRPSTIETCDQRFLVQRGKVEVVDQ